MKRPVFLTIWLVLMSLDAVFSVYSYTAGSYALTQTFSNFPSWAITVYAVLSVIDVIAVAMLWMWRKMGFYMVAGFALVASLLNIMIMGSAGVVSSVIGLAGVGILYWAMKPVWGQFK
ncbi:MAG: hypothetical protein NUV98_04415 [Candidatus Roizmanbacteria bacterium]|nr:hypothetical protein [Candidatus Roizmanbacteria bacterium]